MGAVLVSDFKEVDGANRCRYGRPLVLWQKKGLGSKEIAQWEQPIPNHTSRLPGQYVEQLLVCVD
jgi:hypothetical protein